MTEATNGISELLGKRDLDQTKLALLVLENMIWPILLVTLILFSIVTPRGFLKISTLQLILYSSSSLGLLVLAESLCLISGNFDLSIASIAGFSGLFTALVLTSWYPSIPPVLGIPIILVVAGGIGLLNGISIGVFGVNPFLQTLTFLIIFEQMMPVLSSFGVQELPPAFLYLGSSSVGPTHLAVIVVVGLYVLAWFVLRYSSTGMAIYAVGGDELASTEAGINTTLITVLVFVVSGMLSGLSGLLLIGYLGAATTSLAIGSLFPAFAAAVIGGISLYGGRGNVLGALGGVLLLGTIQSGLAMLSVEPKVVKVINGLILLFAVLLYTGEAKLRERLLAH